MQTTTRAPQKFVVPKKIKRVDLKSLAAGDDDAAYDKKIANQRLALKANADGQCVFPGVDTDIESARKKGELELFELEREAVELQKKIDSQLAALTNLGMKYRRDTVYRLKAILAFLNGMRWIKEFSANTGRITMFRSHCEKTSRIKVRAKLSQPVNLDDGDENVEWVDKNKVFLDETIIPSEDYFK